MSNRRRIKPNRSLERAEEALTAAAISLVIATLPPQSAADLARADQLAAAARDRARAMHARLPSHQLREGAVTTDALAIIARAWQRRGVAECEHYRDALDAGDQVFLTLSGPWAVCVPCLSERELKGDDGRCDVCDLAVPGQRFREFLVAVGNLTLHGNVGDCCAQSVLAALPRGGR